MPCAVGWMVNTHLIHLLICSSSFSTNDRNVIKHHKSKTHAFIPEMKKKEIKKTNQRIIQSKQHLENQNQIH